MIRKEDVFRIGRIGKPHGVKGEMNFMFDDDVFDRDDADYLIIETEGILVPFFIDEYRFRNDSTALVLLDGIDSQERARELTGCDVYYPRTNGEDDDLSSWAKIEGFAITNANDGKAVGTITAVDDTTVNTLFVVEKPEGGELLIPAAEELIRNVDFEARTIEMSLPEGLLTIQD